MRMDKLTSKLQSALGEAQSLAVGRDHNEIQPQHLLTALLDAEGGTVRPLLDGAGLDVRAIRNQLLKSLDDLPTVADASGDVSPGQALMRVLNLADKLARDMVKQLAKSKSGEDEPCRPAYELLQYGREAGSDNTQHATLGPYKVQFHDFIEQTPGYARRGSIH